MTDQGFLRRRRTVHLMKEFVELRRNRGIRQAKAQSSLREPSRELKKSLQLIEELAAKLDAVR